MLVMANGYGYFDYFRMLGYLGAFFLGMCLMGRGLLMY